MLDFCLFVRGILSVHTNERGQRTMTGKKFISKIVAYSKYAKYLPDEQRRETIDEIFLRNRNMHVTKYPHMEQEIDEVFELMKEGKFLPAMRSLQFGGDAILKHEARMYNCSACGVDDTKFFSEAMYLLLCGCGLGYSVRNHHIDQLPDYNFGLGWERFVIDDSIEGWSNAIDRIMAWAFYDAPCPDFIYDEIRPAGSRLSSGVIAPGHEKLQQCLNKIIDILWEQQRAGVKRMTSIVAHDIACHTADCVVSGGVRRSAMIVLFDWNDIDMLECKIGNWWEKNPQRARANNSAALDSTLSEEQQKEQFDFVMKYAKGALLTGSGDPAIIWIEHPDYLFNPCKPLRSTILTENGYITFKQALEMDALKVVTNDGSVKDATKPFMTKRNATVMRLYLSNGSVIEGTPNHLHKRVGKTVRYDGHVRPNIKDSTWVELGDFQVNDYVEYNLIDVHENKEVDMEEYKFGAMCGWIVGDGWKSNNTDAYGLCFGVNEPDVKEMFEQWLGVKAKPHKQKPDTCSVINLSKEQSEKLYSFIGDNKFDVEKIRLQSYSFKLGWLSALFTADGSVRPHSRGVELYSVNKDLVLFVQSLLNEFGVYSSVCTHNYAKSYIAKDGLERNNQDCFKVCVAQGLFKRIGLLSKFKQDLLDKCDEVQYRNNGYLRVVAIDPEYSVESVYDITVDSEEHSFIDSGVTTHNCAEAYLNYNSCNLVEIVGRHIKTQEDLNASAKAGAFWATLQAGYTKFKYLRPKWQERTEEEALIGVGITGMVDSEVLNLDLKQAAEIVKAENERVAKLIGINKAHRTTVIKPAGNSTLFAECYGSGCHDAFSTTSYIRRMRIGKNEPIYHWLIENTPKLVEDEAFDPTNTAVLSVPIRVNAGEVTHTVNDDPIAFLERVKHIYDTWILGGHNEGPGTNNVSATCYVTPEQHDEVFQWMWDNRKHYKGISLLPKDNANYPQMPLELADEDVINALEEALVDFDPRMINEPFDMVNFVSEGSCVSGQCSII